MMIDIANEQLIPIREVPKCLPSRPTGKRVHISAVYRWVRHGLRGTHLESVKIGGTTYTSMEALQRFADGLEHDKQHSSVALAPFGRRRQKQIDWATRQVRSILGSGQQQKHRD